MILVVTNSHYWYKRYIEKHGLTSYETRYINDSYQVQGYPRDTKVVLVNGSNGLDVHTLNRIRERFDNIVRDYL